MAKKESEPASEQSIMFARGALIGLLSVLDYEAAQAAVLVLQPEQPTKEDIENALKKIEAVKRRISVKKLS